MLVAQEHEIASHVQSLSSRMLRIQEQKSTPIAGELAGSRLCSARGRLQQELMILQQRNADLHAAMDMPLQSLHTKLTQRMHFF